MCKQFVKCLNMVHQPSDMACLSPYSVKNQNGDKIGVPCNKCVNCRKRYASEWSFRLMQEEKTADNAHFVTLTYDTKHVPITQNGFMSLCKRDIQLFMKRLRKHASKYSTKPIKYYLCGEYGGKFKRPHYHAIIFNITDPTIIDLAWTLGNLQLGSVTGASIGYTLKYMVKQKRIPMHMNDDRIREFGLMSKELGLTYISQNTLKWHLSDAQNRYYIPIQDGKKITMPRYFKTKIYEEDMRITLGEIQRQKAMEKLLKELVKNKSVVWNIDGSYYDHNREEMIAAEARKQLKLKKSDTQ